MKVKRVLLLSFSALYILFSNNVNADNEKKDEKVKSIEKKEHSIINEIVAPPPCNVLGVYPSSISFQSTSPGMQSFEVETAGLYDMDTGEPLPCSNWTYTLISGDMGWFTISKTAMFLNITPSNNPGAATRSTVLKIGNFQVTITQEGACTPPTITYQPTGGTQCEGTTANFNVAASGTNLTYQWLFAGSNIVGATSSTYTINNIQPSHAGRYSVIVSDNGCSITSDNAVLNVDAQPIGGTLSASGGTLICSGTSCGTLTLSGYLGSSTYFQMSTDGGSSWAGCSNTPPAQTLTTVYRARVSNGTCATVSSNNLTVSVKPATVGGTLGGSSSICLGSTSGALTLSGYTGTITKWQKSTNSGSTWTDIASTANTYSPGALTLTTQYRVVITNGCTSVYSTTAQVTVSPVTVAGSVTGGTTICGGSTSALLTLSGHTGSVLKWQSSIDNGTSWSDISRTSATYTSASLNQTTLFRAVVASGACSSLNSGTTKVTVNPAPTVIAGDPFTVCQPAISTAISLGGASVGGGATTGAWSIISGGGALSSTAQTTNPSAITYTPANNYTGTVTLQLTSNAIAPCTAVTAIRYITIYRMPTASAGGAISVCQSTTPSPITLAGATIGGASDAGKWSIISGGGTLSTTGYTNTPATVTYTPEPNFSGTVTLRLTSNSVSVCSPASSDRIITVNPLPSATITIDRPLVTCLAPTATLTAPAGASRYSWAVDDDLIIGTARQMSVSPDVNTEYNLSVQSASGCWNYQTQLITADKVQSLPATSITSSATSSVCPGTSVNLTVNGGLLGTNATWKWYRNAHTDVLVGTGSTITVNPSVTTTYSVRAEGDCNTTLSISVAVNVVKMPNITSQPVTVNVNEGNPATISIATDDPTTTYQWQSSVNETSPFTDIVGANLASYTINSVTSSIGRSRYQCLIANAVCPAITTLSNIALVQVNAGSAIVYTPIADVRSELGNGGTFYIDVNPSVTAIQWQQKRVSDSNFSDLNGATTTGYYIAKTTADQDLAQYRCKLTFGGNVYYSQPATLKLTMPYMQSVLSNANYIYTLTPQLTFKNLSDLNGRSMKDVKEQVSYFDDLGRPMQTVSIHSSPDFKDIVQPVKYDNYGREVEKYLPYEDNGRLGSLRSEDSWANAQPGFYNSNFVDEGGYAKSFTKYEESSLNRTLWTRGAGKDWADSDKKISFKYAACGYKEIGRFTVLPDSKLHFSGYYGEGELTLLETTDEDNRVVQEWKDIEGRIILKRSYTGFSKAGDVAETFYVYDDMGRLRYVLPPKLVDALIGNSSDLSPNDPLITSLGYYYLYDERGRNIEKRIPGVEPVYMVYDGLDRIVLSQDGELRKTSHWVAHSYDAFGRELKTALVVIGVENTQNAALTWYSIVGELLDSKINEGVILTQSWYDTYDGLPAGFEQLYFSSSSQSYYDYYYATQVQGKLTAQEVRVLNPEEGKPTSLKSKFFYDKKFGRQIQTVSELYDGGKLIQKKFFNWVGQVVREQVYLDVPLRAFSVERMLTYNSGGKVERVMQRIYENAWVDVAVNSYNSFWQLVSSKLGRNNGIYVQDVNYRYNIRGWITGINSPVNLGSDLFGVDLNYQTSALTNAEGEAPQPQFTGNIAEMSWAFRDGNPGSIKRMGYRFGYDGLNRLMQGQFYDNSAGSLQRALNRYDTRYTYDINGNIESLLRYGNVGAGFDMIDNLTYTNSGNQLKRVVDGSGKGEGYLDGNTSEMDFTYNANGSMNSDLDRGISVSYNPINLPEVVQELSGSKKVRYVYDAKGTKLATLYYSGNTLEGGNRYEGAAVRRYDKNTGTWVYDYMSTAEGKLAFKGGVWVPQYFIKDHLGNIRSIAEKRSTYSPETGWANQVWQQSYYPFGMTLGTPYIADNNQLGYNGKEKQDYALNGRSLDWLDYGARFYDATLGRWHAIDPLSEKYRKWSPYNYCMNNPIRLIDPDGMAATNYVDENKKGLQTTNDGNNSTVTVGNAQMSTYKQMMGEMIFEGKKDDPLRNAELIEAVTPETEGQFFTSKRMAWLYMNVSLYKNKRENIGWTVKGGVIVEPTEGISIYGEKSTNIFDESVPYLPEKQIGEFLYKNFKGKDYKVISFVHNHPFNESGNNDGANTFSGVAWRNQDGSRYKYVGDNGFIEGYKDRGIRMNSYLIGPRDVVQHTGYPNERIVGSTMSLLNGFTNNIIK